MITNFLDKDSVFIRSNNLLEGIIYTRVAKEKSFVHIKSKFKDPWYNFIVPIVSAGEFIWNDSEEIIKREKEKGVGMSFYVHNSLLEDFGKFLGKKGYKNYGTDVYMHLDMDKPFGDISGKIVSLDRNSYKEYLEATIECFPDWENEREYSEYFYKLSQKPSKNIYQTVLLKIDDKLVSFGSIIISKKLKLAYLHNLGTLEQHRRKGHAEVIIKYLCNVALAEGVREIYGLLEKEEESYFLFEKLNFKAKELFHLFVK